MKPKIPDEAILRAMEGGYRPPPKELTDWRFYALDHGFWSALGKALQWDEEVTSSNFKIDSMSGWEHYALWFTHLILTGGDTESFWAEILR